MLTCDVRDRLGEGREFDLWGKCGLVRKRCCVGDVVCEGLIVNCEGVSP